jgi:hypothetical protein
MLLSAVSVLVIVLQSSEMPEGLMNNPVFVEIPSSLLDVLGDDSRGRTQEIQISVRACA